MHGLKRTCCLKLQVWARLLKLLYRTQHRSPSPWHEKTLQNKADYNHTLITVPSTVNEH